MNCVGSLYEWACPPSPEKQGLFHFMYSRVSLNGPYKSLRMPSELYHRETQDDASQVSAAPSLPAFTKQDQNCKITLQESRGKPGPLISGKRELADLEGTLPNLRLVFIQSINAMALE